MDLRYRLGTKVVLLYRTWVSLVFNPSKLWRSAIRSKQDGWNGGMFMVWYVKMWYKSTAQTWTVILLYTTIWFASMGLYAKLWKAIKKVSLVLY